jgi:hemerythrin superfamily protein
MRGDLTMSAIDMLESQHREVEDLFEEFEKARSAAKKHDVFFQIADKLAVHAAIEEKHFYPAAKAKDTEDQLVEAAEEHLSVKRIIADLLVMETVDETFEAKVKVLQEQVEHHVEEEEDELFPKVEKLLDDETLLALEAEMTATQEQLLAKGNPRDQVPAETTEAAPI